MSDLTHATAAIILTVLGVFFSVIACVFSIPPLVWLFTAWERFWK